jgi:GH15 family glucan-1,4-alpha-glucosidase
MPRIEDYAFLSDTQTGALVSKGGSVDWLCFPRFASGACFAALLGDASNGKWLLEPKAKVHHSQRRYRPNTLILETELETGSGKVRLIEYMPPRGKAPDIVRIVEGLEGRVRMRMEMIIRFDYGRIVPWVRKRHGGLEAVAGPDALIFRTPVRTHGKDLTTVAEFTVGKGDRVPFVLTWYPSHEALPKEVDPERALLESDQFWTHWSRRCQAQWGWREAVMRSLVTLKGLTYAPTGGIVAAATTSLPERIGGPRNWDYRYCWLRDATFTLFSLMKAGYVDEARAWREWLLRAVAGSPGQMQIMYGVRGERRIDEYEIPWLSGYEKSAPVRIGNAASNQSQLDVYGEVLDSMYQAHLAGLENDQSDWRLESSLIEFLESKWQEPDEGIWEVRGGPRHFTHSKMMAWVAFDRAVRLGEETGFCDHGEMARWRAVRDRIHREVCEKGYSEKAQAFTQSYGREDLDASLLMMPLVGFLPANDPRVRNTVEAIRRDLMQEGFVLRYRPESSGVDGLAGGEGVFLPCSFWLANCLHLIGQTKEALELFERLLALRNDLGLLSEEYDPVAGRLVGNFPQAFSHVALVNSARILSGVAQPHLPLKRGRR